MLAYVSTFADLTPKPGGPVPCSLTRAPGRRPGGNPADGPETSVLDSPPRREPPRFKTQVLRHRRARRYSRGRWWRIMYHSHGTTTSAHHGYQVPLPITAATAQMATR